MRETDLRAGQLVQPLFISELSSSREPIATAARHFERLSISAALEEAREVAALGVGGVMLFGIPASKDA